MKEYNLRRHYETKHQDKYKHLDMKQKLQKVEELKRRLVSQQTMFVKAKSQSEAAVKPSFIEVAEIAKEARPFTEGECQELHEKSLQHCVPWKKGKHF